MYLIFSFYFKLLVVRKKIIFDVLAKRKVEQSLAAEVFYIVDTCQNVTIGLLVFIFGALMGLP